MDIFFGDDSKQKSSRKNLGDLVAFGGYLIQDTCIRPLASDVDEVLKSFHVPLDTEIKWSLPHGNWIRDNLPEFDKASLYQCVLEVLNKHNAVAVVAIWDCGRTTLKGIDAFEKCVDFVFERMSIHLAKNDSYCLIIADRPGGGKTQEETFLNTFIERLETGTEYVPPDRVLLNILTTPSKMVRQLQLADLITSISTAMVAKKYKYAKSNFEKIKPLLMKNSYGYIGGTGLKLFPDQLINLYHWIIEEDSYIRIGLSLRS